MSEIGENVILCTIFILLLFTIIIKIINNTEKINNKSSLVLSYCIISNVIVNGPQILVSEIREIPNESTLP